MYKATLFALVLMSVAFLATAKSSLLAKGSGGKGKLDNKSDPDRTNQFQDSPLSGPGAEQQDDGQSPSLSGSGDQNEQATDLGLGQPRRRLTDSPAEQMLAPLGKMANQMSQLMREARGGSLGASQTGQQQSDSSPGEQWANQRDYQRGGQQSGSFQDFSGYF